MTWDDVVAIGVSLRAVEIGSAQGASPPRVKGSFRCRHREGSETLAIRRDSEERPSLLGLVRAAEGESQ